MVTPSSLRELASGLRGRNVPAFDSMADIFEQCAHEIESRDAQIDGLNAIFRQLRAGGRQSELWSPKDDPGPGARVLAEALGRVDSNPKKERTGAPGAAP